MNFEQSFSQQQNQVQKMAMTQQLQQSIQMLQYNQEDLLNFLNQKALGNPLIEVSVPQERLIENFPTTIAYNPDDDETNYMNQIPDTYLSLFEYIYEQIHLTMRDTRLRELVIWLSEYLDTNGYLTITLEEAERLTKAQPLQILDALVLLQQLEPGGVGARNLQECLMLQTERHEDAPNMAYIILEEEFDLFTNRKWKEITRKLDVSLNEIQRIFDFIQTLTPYPGALFNGEKEQFLKPDLFVEVDSKELKVISVKSGLPVIAFQSSYYEDMIQVKDKDVTHFIKEKQAEYDWLQRSLTQRGDTILRVGTAIVKKQKGFFILPDHPVQPLTLKDIATELEIHESTVSRSINDKYLETTFGIFELKHFFTNALNVLATEESTSEQSELVSTNEVKKKLIYFIDSENKRKPLSDQKLTELLAKDGVEISRRTVAKYREALLIPTSLKRKRFEE
ncbi:RNA polymerase, sigma 54 subunit, RpoN/SigL [Carnobacterium iners]|uniref:RNA polymerase, sigma 54 subunit, RpoN/SigL n=1 Tax=Carnobacterium iners TaxID=1073423 RepID=A0A1X7MPQ9_9LACT|nr:RNA polymerase factor sigma-54 [Carnobacterium iners]SEK86330.1 RNA polymerase, sigma 54 subunit, RpoN/SigL [Carnobacterium iners]SMH26829.1 RNA polymerase, sigma 54 subunit, RpoN/SigL [Carnobacterium iners]